MFHVAAWLVIAFLAVLWSTGLWALHAFATWILENASALARPLPDPNLLDLPAWLTALLPPDLVQAVLVGTSWLAQWTVQALEAAPALSGGLTALAWVIGVLGLVLLLAGGAGLHLLISAWQRRSAPAAITRANSPIATR